MSNGNLYASAIAGIRTGVAALVGLLVAFLISRGIEVPEEFQAQLIGVLVILATAGYNAGVIWLERNVNPLFGVLLGIPRTPAYAGVAPRPQAGRGRGGDRPGPYED